jgi:hypothetical protein
MASKKRKVDDVALQKLPNGWAVQQKKSTRMDDISSWGKHYDEFHDPRFVDLNMDQVRAHLRMYEQDSDVQTFARASLNYALSGGIQFERKGKTLSDQGREWLSEKWSGWVREIEKQMFCLGFALATYKSHKDYGAEPCAISMEHVDIKYCLDVNHTPTFRVYERMDANFGVFARTQEGLIPWGRRRILNVRYWCLSPPMRNGTIRSALTTLMADLVYERHLLQCALVADQSRARPPLVTQRVDPKYTEKVVDLMYASSVHANFNTRSATAFKFGDGTGPAVSEPYPNQSTMAVNADYRNASSVVDFMNAYDSDSQQGIAARIDRMLSSRINNKSLEQLYLEDGRELVSQVLAEPPSILLDFRQNRMTRVALAFGITLPALIKSTKKANAGTEMNKASTKGKDEDGTNSMYFEVHQRELKQRLVGYIKEMYLYMHVVAFALEEIQKVKKGESDSMGDLGVIVSLPGTPDDTIIKNLYYSGVLKYSAYIDMMSKKHCIPKECFETKPQLDLKQLNGIVEPKPTTAA